MKILVLYQVFAWLVCFSAAGVAIRWLLNDRSDYSVIAGCLLLLTVLIISVKTRAFTKNPFSKPSSPNETK